MTFHQMDTLVRHVGHMAGVCNPHNFNASNRWPAVEENAAGKEELRRRIRVLFGSLPGHFVGDERLRMIREYAEENL